MRETRLYSSTVYEQDLKTYETQLLTETDPAQRARLQRWIATTRAYLIEAQNRGM